MNKVIAIDFDSVINDLLSEWIKYLNITYGLNKSIEDILYWDMTENYPQLTVQQIFSPLYDPLFWLRVPLVPNAKKVIREMKKEGYKVVVVTDSDYRIIKFKWENCLLRLLDKVITSKDIIITSQKSLIKCDYIIDDYENNLKDSKAIRLLIDYPYNRNAAENTFDYRCNNIEDAWECILHIEENNQIKEKFKNV